MLPADRPCAGCGKGFDVYPSRVSKAKFCNSTCYGKNQRKRAGHESAYFIEIGQKINWLTVLEKNGGAILVKCMCGSEKLMQANAVASGRVKSCGCYNREKGRKEPSFTAWAQWFRYLKYAAKARDIEFLLSLHQVKDICTKDCTYCGIAPRPWTGARNMYLASARNKKTVLPDHQFADSKILFINGIDRVDSSKGYAEGNVQPCCQDCNLAKLDRSDDNFKSWIYRCYQHIYKEEK